MLTTSTGVEARAGLLKPPGRWLLSQDYSYTDYDRSAGATAVDEDAAWAVAEDLNGAGVGGAAPRLVPTLDLLEAARCRLALAKLSHPRLGPPALTWDPDAEKMTGLLVVGVRLYPWPDVEDDLSDDAEADEVEPALRTCIQQVRFGCDSLNAEADVQNARTKLRNPCRCYHCLMQQLAVAIDLGPKFTGVAFSNNASMAIFPSAVACRAQEAPQLETPAGSEPEPEEATLEVSPVSEGVPGLGSEPVLVVGDAALALPLVHRPLGALAQPSKGVAMDWSALEAVWRHSYTQVLCVDPRDHALVMTEPSVNPKATRERLTTLAFTTFRVPCFYLLNSSSEFGACLLSTCAWLGFVLSVHSLAFFVCSGHLVCEWANDWYGGPYRFCRHRRVGNLRRLLAATYHQDWGYWWGRDRTGPRPCLRARGLHLHQPDREDGLHLGSREGDGRRPGQKQFIL